MRLIRSRRGLSIIFVAVTLTVSAAFLFRHTQQETPVSTQAFPSLRPEDLSGFEFAEPGRVFDFPTDHGPHPEFQTEWWYFTGNLETEDGRQFGYQLTFFRRSLVPPADFAARTSDWATNEVYFAHFTISDIEQDKFTYFERFSRGGQTGLAGAKAEPFQVWLEDWEVVADTDGHYTLNATQDEVKLTLSLVDLKGPILQGDEGYSSKGPEVNNASYYYSLTRLQSSGTIELQSDTFAVSGSSWMDHEFSTSALGEGEVGWDWFGLQLDNGHEIMAFQLRDASGPLEDTLTFVLVAPDGSVAKATAFTLDVQDTWTSPHSGATYPSEWIITAPDLELELSISPLIADQELGVSFTYWEGAVELEGTLASESVTGRGYVELTGYAESMAGQF